MCLICCVQHAVVYTGGVHDLFLSHLNIRILCFELLLTPVFCGSHLSISFMNVLARLGN